MEGATHAWEQEVYGKSLYLPLNFAVNLILLQKVQVLIIKKTVHGCHTLLIINPKFILSILTKRFPILHGRQYVQ